MPSLCFSYQIHQQLAWCAIQARKELIIEEAAGAGGVVWRVISQVCLNIFQTHFYTCPLSNLQVRRHFEQTSHEERLPAILDIPTTSDNKQKLVTLIFSTLTFLFFFWFWFIDSSPDFFFICRHFSVFFILLIVYSPELIFFVCVCSWLINVGMVEKELLYL